MSTDTSPSTDVNVTPAPAAAATTRMKSPWSLVALREVQVKLTDRNFLLGTGATILLIAAVFALQGFLMSGGAPSFKVAVTDTAAATVLTQAEQDLQASDPEATVEVVEVADTAAAEAMLVDEEVHGALLPEGEGWELVTNGETDGEMLSVISEAVRTTALQENAEAAGTSMEALTAGTTIETRDLSGGDEESRFVAWVAGFAMAMLFYMAAMMFGMAIANSVVEEKQSRIVEILAAAISVRALLTGKVIGNTLLALGQIAILGAVALVGLTFTNYDQYLSMVTEAFLWYIPFFVLGFLALACIWAAAGAMASRTEDLQSTTMPLTMGLVLVFIVGLSLDGAAKVIGSFVPVLSTILMPMRLLEGSAQWWEALLALGLTAAFCALTIAAGTRLYRRSLLQTSGRVSLKAAWAGGE
ncbi:ABC transporter permease [Ornithinimicrobium sp. F0845]|uniref:ABC transporter permease n=1 Tax=Ornithinimicrobium sp. F0845 TaxID=2926412 RepID=UPI001FF3394D|nr:ABC transporter permease [Ornithinimicrobium sp. F0845]MCK0112167.1 ABC transporter permease [Ornithinimicrobium sp. F0845]